MVNTGSKTIDAYNVYHEVYDAEISDFWQRFPVDILDFFFGHLPGREVLNVGSGTGRDSVLLREKELDVTCLDGSPNMVRRTKELGFHSILGDIRSLEFREASFDGIWAYSSLIHLNFQEMHEVLSRIYEVLKPNGLLLLGLIEGSGNERLKIGSSSYERYFEYYDDLKLKQALGNLSLEQIYLEKYKPGNQVYLNYILRKKPSNR